MKKNLKKIRGIVLVAGVLLIATTCAADNQAGDNPDKKTVVTEADKNPVPTIPSTKSSEFSWWKPWTWFGKSAEQLVKVEQKNENSQNIVSTKKHQNLIRTKDIVFGLTPAGVCVWALFFMPDSVRKHIPKNFLTMLHDPKMIAPLWFAAGAYFSHKISKVRYDLLNSKNVVDVGGAAGQKAIVGAFADSNFQKNTGDMAYTLVTTLYKENPAMFANLASYMHISVMGGGGISEATFTEMATKLSKDLGILVAWTSSFDKKQDETLALSKEIRELQKLILKQLKNNEPLTIKMYNGVCNVVKKIGAGAVNHIRNIDFDTSLSLPEDLDFKYKRVAKE